MKIPLTFLAALLMCSFAAVPVLAEEGSGSGDTKPLEMRYERRQEIKDNLQERRIEVREKGPDGEMRTEFREKFKENAPPEVRERIEARANASGTPAAFFKDRILEGKLPVPGTVRERFEERLANPEQAKEDVMRRLSNLGTLDDRLKRLATLKGGIGGEVSEELEARRAEFEALREKLKSNMGTTTDKAQLAELMKASRGYALVVPKAAVVAAADRALATAEQLSAFSQKLAARVEAAGIDSADEALASFDAHIASAQVEAQGALDILEGVTDDNSDETAFAANKELLKQARDKIAAAHQELVAARKDAQTVIMAVKGTSEEAS